MFDYVITQSVNPPNNHLLVPAVSRLIYVYECVAMCLYSPIQKGSGFIQLLGVFLCVVHVISQAAVA